MKHGNILYASDKALFDALVQFKFKKSDLAELFISRGVIVSKASTREDLSKYFSRLNHDYYDHELIASVLGVAHRKEKSSLTSIKNDIEKDSVEKALGALQSKRQALGERVEVRSTNKGHELIIRYTEVDYNKSEFKQVIEKEAVLLVESSGSELQIRWPQNDFVEVLKEEILDELAGVVDSDEELNVQEIELTHVLDVKLRTKFFVNLINSMSGYDLCDVTDVYVFNPKKSGDDELGVHISKASLKGEGVLESEELLSLYKKGFYLSKIVWKAKADQHEADLYRFEAQFSDAENCKRFSYMASGVYKFKIQQKLH